MKLQYEKMRNVTNPQFTPGSLPPVFLEPRAPQIEHYEIDLTPILPGRSIHLHRTVAQRSGEAANTHRIGDRGEVWCGVLWCGWKAFRNRNPEHPSGRCCVRGERGFSSLGGDPLQLQYSSKLQSTVRNVLYFSFLLLRMLGRFLALRAATG